MIIIPSLYGMAHCPTSGSELRREEIHGMPDMGSINECMVGSLAP